MDLTCYLHDGWKPRIRPASQRRSWMDDSPESFAYRCLPLNIANAHGWEILSPCGFEASWNGGQAGDDVTIRLDPGVASHDAPVALFGLGTLTFHVAGLFRTAPGWNLWVGGAPNAAKDGIAPLGGIIETDWSPYTFTMNWRFTRPHHAIRFEENEPFCFIFPVQRQAIEESEPRFASIDEAPELKAQFEAWSRSRNAFQAEVKRNPPARPADKWQKLYYRGVDPGGIKGVPDHKSHLRPPPFANGAELAVCPVAPTPARAQTPPTGETALRKRDWLLRTQQRLRGLSPAADAIRRMPPSARDAFLDQHYALNRPVVLAGAVADWPATSKWSAHHLRRRLGDTEIELQAGRTDDADFERNKDAHRIRMPFAAFIDRIAQSPGNDLYLTAYNSAANAAALAPLADELGSLDAYLAPGAAGMLWIGPAGSFTPLHHDLTNNLLVQLRGRKRVVLVSPAETPRLYNDRHVFSEIRDIAASDLDLKRFPLAAGVRAHQVTLEPGDALFIPVGWWHQVTALDFSVSATYTNFIWPNDAYEDYPTA
ncbi:hypothetical protein sos41_40330 [Alphaproteobacteria bacterium SO-S41]|nr:hypothetical protein sos41_40330 [Alphaproteobacteria bacterium SO-S41]